MAARYGQSSMRRGGAAMELSDSEDEDEIGSSSGNRNGNGNGHGHGDDEDDDLSQWTLDTFTSRPIGGDAATNTIRGMYTKMEEPLSRIDESLRLFGEVAAAIADCDEKHPMIRQVQQQFLSTLETRYLIQIKIDVLKMLEQHLKAGENIERIEEQFAQECATRTEEWSKKSDRAKYKTDKQFEAFRQAIWDKNHDEPLGPLSLYLEKGENDEEESDDEVEVGGTVKNYICPLSRGLLKDAYTSQLCGHSFTGPYIIDMIKKNKKQPTKCPFGGCPHKLRMEDIKSDPALQRNADAYAQKQRKRERETARAHDSEEEVLSE